MDISAVLARLAPALVVLCLGSAAPACKKTDDVKPADNAAQSQIVAKVGETNITVADVEARLNGQSPFARARYASLEKKKELVDDMIRFEVMAAEAERRGYGKDPDVVRAMKQQMVSKFMEREFESKRKAEDVPEADVEKYYADHAAEFNKSDEVRVSEIVVSDKVKADKVHAEAKARSGIAGADQKAFGELVSRYSEDEDSKQRGGDLGFFDKDSTTAPKAVIAASLALGSVGDISEPVKTDKGWAVLMLMQKRPGFRRPLSEVKRDIQQRLFADTRNKALDAFVADLMKKAKIESHDETLDQVVLRGTAGAPSSGPSLPRASSERASSQVPP